MPGMEQRTKITTVGPVFLDWSKVSVPRPYMKPLADPVEQSASVADKPLADYTHHVRGFVLAWCADNNPLDTVVFATVDEAQMTSLTQFAGTTKKYSVEFHVPSPDTPWPRFIIDRAEVMTTHFNEATIGEKR